MPPDSNGALPADNILVGLFSRSTEPDLVVEARSVRLRRAGKRGWFGNVARPLRVLVDEERIGALRYGEEMTIELDDGVHHLRVQWPTWHAVGFLIGRFVNFNSPPVQIQANGSTEISLCCGVESVGYQRDGSGRGGYVAALSIWDCRDTDVSTS